MERVGLSSDKETNVGGIIEKLLEKFVEPTLQQPTFVIGYPIETSPLAKKDPSRPGFTRRFEGYVRGREICNAFSEINDPLDQLERFEQQARGPLRAMRKLTPWTGNTFMRWKGACRRRAAAASALSDWRWRLPAATRSGRSSFSR